MTRTTSPFTVFVLVLLCIALLIPALCAWLVNVEIALQSMNIEATGMQGLLPPAWYARMTDLSVDLSTISTLVPVLLLIFPLFMGLRVLILSRRDAAYVHRVIYDPYPPHFPFFLVMLGLTGTLYGLLIGLSASGVGELGAEAPSADAIQETIDRLMGGTATALLSSLVGLVGAFLAARPLTWAFRRVAGIPEEDSQRNLVEVIGSLTRDLQALGHASREFSEHLNVASAERLDQRLNRMEVSLDGLARTAAETNARFEKLLDLQEQQAKQLGHLEHLSELKRIDRIDAAVSSATQGVARMGEDVQALRTEQEQARTLAEQALDALRDGHRESAQALHGITEVLEQNRRDTRADRGALRQALGHYITDVTDDNE